MMLTPENARYLPVLSFAHTLYVKLNVQDQERCHIAVEKGQNLDTVIKGKSAQWVLQVCEQSKKTEALASDWCSLNAKQLLDIPFEGLDDYSLATLAWIMFEGDWGDTELNRRLYDRNDEALIQLSKSTNRNILVDYEFIKDDVEQYGIAERIKPVSMAKP
ncbi:MAG: hypothetical protein GY847_19800 [Proteobacteria bacterium]|nr:hypothetical protein [Pseudomonadota bacterium]